jgi:hypothetical protein
VKIEGLILEQAGIERPSEELVAGLRVAKALFCIYKYS